MKKKYKVYVIGHFGGRKTYLDGQTVKTKTLFEEITKMFGCSQVKKFDTHNKVFSLIKMFFSMPFILKRSKNILIMPAQNGIKIISFLLTFWNRFFKTKIHYCVIGGWLPNMLERNISLKKRLLKFSYIYVETSKNKINLMKLGFQNVIIVTNCKNLKIVNNSYYAIESFEPMKLCTLSRVIKQKGIEDIVNAVKYVNSKFNVPIFNLDIYGPIDSDSNLWFEHLKRNFTKDIKYCGTVDYNKTTDVLKNYFALVFPTRFYTEGIPGSLIDAYSSGVPIITSRWENYRDAFIEGITGLSYNFEQYGELVDLLIKIKNDPDMMIKMRQDCLNFAQNFMPSSVINKFKFD